MDEIIMKQMSGTETVHHRGDHHKRDSKAGTLATNSNGVYKRAIIQAIDELRDFNLRSNRDAIRRHVQSSLGPEHIWNDTVFLKTLKNLTNDGDIEQFTHLYCELTPEFKTRRTTTMKELLKKRSQLHPYLPTQGISAHPHPHPIVDEKIMPVKKPEHFKLKIIGKKEYDKLHMPVKNPMDTH